MVHLRSILFSSLAAIIFFAGSPASAISSPAWPGLVLSRVPEIASVSVFEACAIALREEPPSEVVEHSYAAESFLSSFAQFPQSSTIYQEGFNRLQVGVVQSPITGFDCVVRISGSEREEALKAVLERASTAKSRWSEPVLRNYFSRALWVSINRSGTYLLMIPVAGSDESDPVVIAGNDVGGVDALAKSPDNTAIILRAALDVCASWIASDAGVDVPVANFENNPRIKISKSLAPLRGCTVKSLTADPPAAASKMYSALKTMIPDLISLNPSVEMKALGYAILTSSCYEKKSGSYASEISGAPLGNEDPFRFMTISFSKVEGSCKDLAAYMLAR